MAEKHFFLLVERRSRWVKRRTDWEEYKIKKGRREHRGRLDYLKCSKQYSSIVWHE